MPGIITHNKIFKESIKHLSRRPKKSYLLRSIEALFSSHENMRAGLFGSIGPNIFDYLPSKRGDSYCSKNSFYMHDGHMGKFISAMIDRIYAYDDKNTEWAAIQRAYAYGMISHIISDSIFHPYVFYFSGFPDSFDKKQTRYYREQNLLFEYSIDYYFLYADENRGDFRFSIEEMLPVKKKIGFPALYPSLRSLLLESLELSNPEIYNALTFTAKNQNPDEKYISGFNLVDLIPFFLKTAYSIKFSRNPKLRDFFQWMKRNSVLFSDFIIQYPNPKRINRDILNHHREKWQYPDGKIGLHYESADNLLAISCEKTIEIWEKIEPVVFGLKGADTQKDLSVNLYTGSGKTGYYDMKNKNPIKIQI